MRPLFTLLVLLAFPAAASAQVLTASKILSGSGTDVASAVAIDPQGNILVAGTTTSPDFPIVNGLIPHIPDAALHVSVDGQTFAPATLTPPNVTAIAASSGGRTLLAADLAAIYRSVDGGATWSAAPTVLSGAVVTLAIDPTNASNAYAIANLNSSAIFLRSADGGVTWQSSGEPGGGFGVTTSRILIDPQNPASIYALFSTGLYHSADSGYTWQEIYISGPPVNTLSPSSFAIAPSQPLTAYACYGGGLAKKSSDGGATWQPIGPLYPVNMNTIAVDPGNPDVVWVADISGSITRSADGGATVQNMFHVPNSSWQAIAIDPADSSHIFAADASNVYASLDDGANWSVVAIGQFSNLLATPLAIFAGGSLRPTLFVAKLDASLTQILFSTFIGPAQPYGIAMALDASGNALVTGTTQWADFPTSANALQPAFTSANAGFAAKIRADGGALLYSTFLNGFTPQGATFDSSGDAVIAGGAPPGFAVTSNAYQSAAPGPCTRLPISVNFNFSPPQQTAHAMIAKLSPDGRALLYASYLSGSCGDTAKGVQLDSAGNIYLTGLTYSLDFPVTPNAMAGTFPSVTGTASSGFVSELSADGTRLLYSSFFGGGENNSGNAIALDGQGNVYIGGSTQATASPGALAVANPMGCEYIVSTAGPVDESFDYVDGFVMKLALNGAPPAFFATIGGPCQDSVQSLSLDGAGNPWLAGTTYSADFPLKTPAGALGIGGGGFVAEIDPSGSNLLFSSLTGGYNAGWPVVAANRTGAYVGSAVAGTSKAGATSAIAAFLDGSQSVPIALNSIQGAGSAPMPELPFFTPPSVAPGELIVLNGSGSGPASSVTAKVPPGGAFPTTLAGVQVSIDGIAAPLVSVQASRIECQAPFELDGAALAQIQVTYNGQSSNTFPAAVVAQQPSLLAVANADGTPNTAANPAPVGSIVALYLTGLGQTIPGGVDGALSSSPAIVPRTLPTVYEVSGVVRPAFLGAAVGESTGVYQMNIPAPPPAAAAPGVPSVTIEGSVFPYYASTPIYVK